MQLRLRLAALLAAAALSLPALASVTPYVDAGAFNAALSNGSYTEQFNGLSDPPPASYSNGQFGFGLSSSSSLYYTYGNQISTNDPDAFLTITFTQGTVRGVGGNFFLTDFDGSFDGFYPLLVLLSTGETFEWIPASDSSFVGFVSDTAFTWMSITPYNYLNSQRPTGFFATIDNLTIGDVAGFEGELPEPASLALVGLALGGLFALRRRG